MPPLSRARRSPRCWDDSVTRGLRFALEPRQRARDRLATAVGQDLDRDVRFSFVSVARYTWPMPPSPMWAVTSYGPMRVPGVSDMLFGLNRRDYMRMRRIQENRSCVTPM